MHYRLKEFEQDAGHNAQKCRDNGNGNPGKDRLGITCTCREECIDSHQCPQQTQSARGAGAVGYNPLGSLIGGVGRSRHIADLAAHGFGIAM